MSDTSDFTPQPYSLQNQPLTPTAKTATSELTLTASASMMTNFQPALPVSSHNAIHAVEDINGNPMIFSVGNTNELYAIISDPSEQTGWAQIDLSTALIEASGDPTAIVHKFNAIDLQNGTFALAMATKSGSDDSAVCKVFVTEALNSDPAADYWSDFEPNWVPRETPDGKTLRDVSGFVLGPSDNIAVPGVVAMVSGDGAHYDRYIVNADAKITDPEAIWSEWKIPGNPQRTGGGDPIVDVVIGKDPAIKLWGTYALYYSGDNLELNFSTLAMFGGERKSGLIFNCPQNATALSSVRTDYSRSNLHGCTDLFVAGDGVWRYDLAALSAKSDTDQVPVVVPTTQNMGTVDEMELLCDGTTVALWTLAGGRLTYLESQTSDSTQWTDPVTIRKDVAQISAMRNRTFQMNELFQVTAGNGLLYLYRDPATTIWRAVDIQVVEVDSPLPTETYTTSLKFTGDSQGAWSGPISLTASSRLYVMVNGVTHIVDANLPVMVHPDSSGTLTVITKITSTSVPIITLASADFAELIDISPSQVITANLQSFAASSNPAAAKTQVGDAVFPSDAALTPDQFNTAMAQVTAASDAITPQAINIRENPAIAANLVNTTLLTSSVPGGSFAVIPGDSTLYTGADADAVVSESNATAVSAGPLVSAVEGAVAFFGDVWSSIVHGVEEIGSWALNIVEDGIHLIITVGKNLLKLALKTLEQVFEVLAWIAKQIGMVLEKFIQWIGQLFGWDEIEAMSQVITNGANASFDYARDALGKVGTGIDAVLDDLSVALTGQHLDDSTGSTPALTVPSGMGDQTPNDFYDSTYNGSSAQAQDSSQYPQTPAGGFATYHLSYSTSNGAGFAAPATSDEDALSKLISDFSDMAGAIGTDIGETLKATLQAISDGISDNTITIADLIKTICDDLIHGVLKAGEDFVDGMVKLAQDALGLVKDALNKAIKIPFISALYELMTGNSSLTLLNAMSFLVAIPATEMLRITGQSALITQLTPLASATTSSDFLGQLGYQSSTTAQLAKAGLRPQASAFAVTTAAATDDSPNAMLVAYQAAGSVFGVFSAVLKDVISVTQTLVPKVSKTLKKMFSWLSAGSSAIALGLTLPIAGGKGILIVVLRWLLGLFGLISTFIFATAPELNTLAPAVSAVFTTVDLGLAIVYTIGAIEAGMTSLASWSSLIGGMIHDVGGLFNVGNAWTPDEFVTAKTILVTSVIICFGLGDVLKALAAGLTVYNDI